ncbi:hypothetical protein A3L11_08700 [Thermococcus siculi]|uniref:Uncharacterized protein n=1 Tax=Thermococcus siculi TaxID=72803 RepID=A0A2Z2MYT4_9EURY|nr:hypothetical protein A3L11_08700 [Thermococcus siculi]
MSTKYVTLYYHFPNLLDFFWNLTFNFEVKIKYKNDSTNNRPNGRINSPSGRRVGTMKKLVAVLFGLLIVATGFAAATI